LYNTESDEDLMRIIQQVEAENGATLAMAIPAVTFIEDDPDEKIYILLLTTYDSDSDSRDWSVSKGRQNTYNYLKGLIKDEIIDPNLSFIIACDTDTTNPMKPNVIPNSKPITVFRFMKVMLDEMKVLDDMDGFDINDFNPSEQMGDKTILEEIL
jgi:hypothetical protein